MRLHSLLSVCLAALLLAACNDTPENTWQGYAEGDYVRVAAMEGGIVEEVAVKRGDRVNQGDVIGFVGMTGWATGPHLHYEVRINNVAQDPMRIALPKAQPLSAQELTVFRTQTQPLVERLALLNRIEVSALR